MTEKALKLATGKDVDVKVQGDKVQIEQHGSKTEMTRNSDMACRDDQGCPSIHRR